MGRKPKFGGKRIAAAVILRPIFATHFCDPFLRPIFAISRIWHFWNLIFAIFQTSPFLLPIEFSQFSPQRNPPKQNPPIFTLGKTRHRNRPNRTSRGETKQQNATFNIANFDPWKTAASCKSEAPSDTIWTRDITFWRSLFFVSGLQNHQFLTC